MVNPSASSSASEYTLNLKKGTPAKEILKHYGAPKMVFLQSNNTTVWRYDDFSDFHFKKGKNSELFLYRFNSSH